MGLGDHVQAGDPMNSRPHIHTPYDGLGQRDVLLNGKLIFNVIYADTRKGFVRVVGPKLRIDKWKKRILWRTLRGHVEVRAKVVPGGER